MAYNNGFPITYQPIYYQPQAQQQPLVPQMQPQQAPPSSNTNIIWVSGEAGAKSYLVAPNTTVQLWDSEAQTIYLKSADASGMPTMKILDYTIRDSAPVQNSSSALMQDPTPEYVTKSEFSAFEDKLQKQLEKFVIRKPKREVEEDE